jgi:mercuric ion transport protein
VSSRVHKQALLAVPGVGVSLLPKLICPLCWPAYAGLLSTLGLGFLISAVYLFPLTTVLLAVAVGSLAFRASSRRGLKPFFLGLAAAVFVLTGKFYFDSPPATYAGVGFLVLASLWNAWPRRANVRFGPVCIPAEGDLITKGRKGEMQQ